MTSITGTLGESTGSIPLATFSGTSASGYVASISWGDGNTSSGTITDVSGVYTVSGNNSFSSYGTLSAVITLTNSSTGGVRTVTDTANVAAMNTPTMSLYSIDSSDGAVTFDWTDSADTRTGMQLEQETPDGNFYLLNGSTGPSCTFTTITAPSGTVTASEYLTPGVPYTFRLRSTATGLSSTYSSYVTISIPAPSGGSTPTYDLPAPKILSSTWGSKRRTAT